MKFKENEILYYVNPFVFTIEKVQISMGCYDHDGLYYIDHTGAYLKEADLHRSLEDAKTHAFNLLNKFHYKKQQELLYVKDEYLKVEDPYGEEL